MYNAHMLYSGLDLKSNPEYNTATSRFNYDYYHVQTLHEKLLLEKLKFLFGNMFWFENYKPSNQNLTFFCNYWNLDWQKDTYTNNGYYLDFYSIHRNDIKKLFKSINAEDLENYFGLIENHLNLEQEQLDLNKKVIMHWIALYKEVINKGKGIVFDLG